MSVQISAKTRKAVYDRDKGCVRCGTTQNVSIHHRTPRGMGGSRKQESVAMANLITLCGSGTTGCHGWVESHRMDAVWQGYIVPRGVDPATIPVRTLRGVWNGNHTDPTTQD